ncbi:MAG: tRNA dihydrouridine synthase DusB [Candidatus Cloacimonetes bacterium]|nr:tRNA dihydrouridine synthase DusB [Candidatus Cloacimonadota bacterium]
MLLPALAELVDDKVWLAPLAGVTDKAFRAVCKRMGADVMVSEMVSADGLLHKPAPSLANARFDDSQRPFGIQLFGSRPDIMARALDVVLPLRPDFIDVNMGCPVKKVVNRGAGSALMREPQRAADIVRAMKNALAGAGLPLSVKFRSGWDTHSVNAVEFGLRMQEAGADILVLHARTRTQMYGGKADWALIAALALAVDVPVVGNGDIWEPEDVDDMRRQTGCSAVMVGRGVMGRPWLFAQIARFRLTGQADVISCKLKVECIRDHYRMTMADKGEVTAMKEMRSHLAWYTKGYAGGAAVRRLVNRSDDREEALAAVEALLLTQETDGS